MVVCRYYFQGGDQSETLSSMYLPPNPTLLDVKKRFPFIGQYHFRVEIQNGVWLDLIQDDRELPVRNEQIMLKVLQISPESESDNDRVLYVNPMEEKELHAKIEELDKKGKALFKNKQVRFL